MARNTFMKRQHVGSTSDRQYIAVALHNKAVKQVQEKNKDKVPVYVPELKMTLYVVPGTDMAPIIAKHKELQKTRGKTLTH
jgi:hypothetical protein